MKRVTEKNFRIRRDFIVGKPNPNKEESLSPEKIKDNRGGPGAEDAEHKKPY
jgi:hypothetical protein